MKKYLTEKTVALSMAALLACGVALGASLSSDERGDVSPIRATVPTSTAVCPCDSCDCDDCACAGEPGRRAIASTALARRQKRRVRAVAKRCRKTNRPLIAQNWR